MQLKSLRLKEVEHLPNRGTFSNVRSSRGCFPTLGYLKADEFSVLPSAYVPVTPQLHVLCSCKKWKNKTKQLSFSFGWRKKTWNVWFNIKSPWLVEWDGQNETVSYRSCCVSLSEGALYSALLPRALTSESVSAFPYSWRATVPEGKSKRENLGLI